MVVPASLPAAVASALSVTPPASVPFFPGIKEHKAWFIGATPSDVARDAQLLIRATLAEFEQVGADALTVAMDNYNIEAEAAGCRVRYFTDGSIPAIDPEGHVVSLGDALGERPVPNPLRDGRMPLLLEAAREVAHQVGGAAWVRGAVSGPLSLAIALVGLEQFYQGALLDPDAVEALLDYATRIILAYARAYADAGVGIIIFESQASPDLVAPAMFEQLALPRIQRIIAAAQTWGIDHVPLIIGGHTDLIADALLATGANNLLCDFSADWQTWQTKLAATPRAIRRNMSPARLIAGTPDALYAEARALIAETQGYAGLIMGTSVVPYGTPTEKLRAIRQACRDAAGAAGV